MNMSLNLALGGNEMRNVLVSSLKYQQAVWEAGANTVLLMSEAYGRVFQQQCDLFHGACDVRRADEPSMKNPTAKRARKKRVKTKSPCTGADLRDHYGNRAHDVDIERI
ncbi:MAG: hypothetical protein HN877_04395 [Rhodospirillaceae bacterium]|jgi:hypothetical protein|nr:hypothetical protein [Rhodospirillaceae bacterium]